MFRFASPVTLRLAPGELLAWRQGRVRLRVLSGAAWVTRPSDLDDHFVHAGQTLELADALIGAETELSLRLEAVGGGPAVVARLRAYLGRLLGARPGAGLLSAH